MIRKLNFNGCCCDPNTFLKNGFGTYKNNICINTPKHLIETKYGCYTFRSQFLVDVCIAKEIMWLLQQGIITINSCCGHGITVPMIIVHSDSIKKMYSLGYENLYHKEMPEIKDEFIPKTIIDNY